MQYIKTLMLAAVLVASATPADPPVFSQKNNCCWVASWIQLINNMPELRERIAALEAAPINDYSAFVASDIGKKLAKETREEIKLNSESGEKEWVKVPALDYYKDHHFSPKNIKNNRSYLTILKTIETSPENRSKLDGELGKLQKNLTEAKFGEFNTPQILSETGNSLISHPIFEDLIAHYPITGTSWEQTAKQGLKDVMEFMERTEIQPRVLLLLEIATPSTGINLRDSFTLDLTGLISQDKHPVYELIGIGVAIPRSHWWAFIKDQYDPKALWWRCDTITGNKRVSQEEIITECKKHPPTYLLYRRVKPDTIREKTTGDHEQDLIGLTEALWELSR